MMENVTSSILPFTNPWLSAFMMSSSTWSTGSVVSLAISVKAMCLCVASLLKVISIRHSRHTCAHQHWKHDK